MLTGDLLSWDQNGYASHEDADRLPRPCCRGWAIACLKHRHRRPGAGLGHLTLTRFFALHVGRVRRRLHRAGGCSIAWLVRRADTRRGRSGRRSTCRYWPAQAWRNAVACLAVHGGRLRCWPVSMARRAPDAGVPLLSPADTDPANAYNAARPEWFLVGVYEFSHLFPGELAIIPIFIVPGVVLASCWPCRFWPDTAVGQLFNLGFTVAVLVGAGRDDASTRCAKDHDNPEHQAAIAAEQTRRTACASWPAARAFRPPARLTLLRARSEDARPAAVHAALRQLPQPLRRPKAQGDPRREAVGAETARLRHAAVDRRAAAIPSKSPGRTTSATRRSAEDGGMVDTVKGWWKDTGRQGRVGHEKKNLEKVVIALSAEAQAALATRARRGRRQADRGRAGS